MQKYTQEEKERFTKTYKELGYTIEYIRSAKMFRRLLENALKNGYPLNYVPENHYLTPEPLLNIAIQYGQTEIFRILLNAGVDVNLKGRYKRNALMAACNNDNRHSFNIDMIKELIARTKDLNERDHFRSCALQMLAKNFVFSGSERLLDCIEYIIKKGADPDVNLNLTVEPSYRKNCVRLEKFLTQMQLKEQLSRGKADVPEIHYAYEL